MALNFLINIFIEDFISRAELNEFYRLNIYIYSIDIKTVIIFLSINVGCFTLSKMGVVIYTTSYEWIKNIFRISHEKNKLFVKLK